MELRGRTSDTFNPSINYDTLPIAEREVKEATIFSGLDDDTLGRLLHGFSWNSFQKPIDVEERDLPKLFQKNTDKTVTLGEAFRTERRLVILGEPGSGKTTLLKWLAVILSVFYGQESERISLASARINPDLDDETQMDDLGVKRIPIFIRVASFNEWRRGNKSSLDDYIGYHLALSADDSTVIGPSGKTIHLSVLHDWLTEMIDANQTVLLLDGLDEINDVAERTDIVAEIDRYLDNRYLSRTTPKLSSSEASRKDWPVDSGGNQVVITSRVAGYKATQLSTWATHLTIEPMSEKAIKRFCQKYVLEARRTAVTQADWDNTVSLKAHLEAEKFIQNIFQLRDKQVYDLTSNPIQLSILAALYLKNNAKLPGQRTELYQATIEEFLKHWDERLDRPPSTSQHTETLKVLSQIAAQMLDNSSLGYIRDDELKDALVRGGIEEQQVDGMLKLASEGVGLLSQRAPRVFSFLHLTFQEYLAGSWLLAQAVPAEAMLSHIDSARWREALLMALGQQALLSTHNSDNKLEQLVTRLLAARHTVRGITPILLIASALREMPQLSAAIIDDLAMAIILAYQELSLNKRYILPLSQLETAFCQLCEACPEPTDSSKKLQHLVLSVLASASHTHRGKALACVRLVTVARYYSEDIAWAIEQLLPFDDETLGWPVDKALSDIASAAPEYLPFAEGSLRYAVTEENTEWLIVIEQNPTWRGLCLMLYGGLDACAAEKIAANETALNEAKRKIDENTNKPDSPTKEQLTKTLEEQKTALEAEQTRLNASRNHFSARRLHRDATVVTPFVISALRLGLSAESIIQPLMSAYQNLSLTLSQRAEIVVALFALDQPITPYLQANTKLQTEVQAIFSRVNFALTQAIQAAAKSSSKALEALANQLPETDWLEIITEIIDINQSYGGKPLTVIELLNHATDVSRTQLMAEQWHYFLTAPSDDRLYNMAVVLDTVGKKLVADKLGLAQAFCAAYSAATQYGQAHLAWVSDKLARKPRSDRQTYRLAFEAIIAIPQPLQFVRGWAIAMLAPEFLKDDVLTAQAIVTALCYVPDLFDARVDALRALGLLSENGLSIALVNKTLRRNAYLLPELIETKATVSWQSVIDELDNLPAAFLNNAYNYPDEEKLDTLFAAEATILFSASMGITAATFLPLIKILPQTNDPENCVLLLARLAFYLPVSVASAVVCTALKIVASQQVSAIKIRLLKDLTGIAHCFPESHVLLDQALNQLTSVIDQQKAAGYTGIYLKQQQASLNQWITNEQGLEEQLGDFTPLKLGAYIYNVKRELGYVDSVDEFWAELASQHTHLTDAKHPPLSDANWATLHKLAQLKAIRLTRQAALSMELVRNHSAADFLTAIKQVEDPSPETLPILMRWQALLDDTARPYCSLLLAELGVIKPATINDLLGLLATTPEDRLRYRIAIIFYVPNLRKEPRFRVSQLGVASVEALALQTKVERKADIRQALGWSFEHIVHDDGEALQSWIQQLDTQGPQVAVAANIILSRIDELDRLNPVAFNALLAGLRNGSIATRQALARSLCVMLAKTRLPEHYWQAVRALIEETQGACLGTMPVIEALCEELAYVLKAAATVGNQPNEFSAAFFKAKAQPLSAWAKKSPDKLKLSLTRIGDNCLTGPRFTERVADAAKLMNTPEAIKFMLDILLLPEIIEPTRYEGLYYFASELLSLLAASIETYPEIFYQVLDAERNFKLRPALAKQLPKIARTHNTFTGRQAAFVLLSYLRKVTPEVCKALQSAMHDVPQVQQIALASIERYREADRTVIDQLKPMLADKSSATAYMTGRLLFCLARNKHLESGLRDVVISLLRTAAEQPDNDREVFLLDDQGSWDYQINQIGMLDQLMFCMVDELTGTAHFSNANPKPHF